MQDEDQFWSRVDRRSPSECWEWPTASWPPSNPYGRLEWQGKQERAHRVAWALANGGDLPIGQINHRCHNARCVNPEHLYEGTQRENMLDRVAAGRGPLGEHHHFSKISDVEVAALRSDYSSGKSQRHLARIYGISQGQVSKIVNHIHRKAA